MMAGVVVGQVELVTLATESATTKAEIADLKKELKAAAKDGASWRSKAEKAERAVESAEKLLEKAMQEHSSTQAALLQVRQLPLRRAWSAL